MGRMSVEQLAKKVVNDYFVSEKKHLIITGRRGIGKTTLLKYLLNGRKPEGLCSESIRDDKGRWPVRVVMRPWRSDEGFIVGLPKDGRCHPVEAGFEKAKTLVDQMIRSDDDWCVLDEIGYLECSFPEYCASLEALFECKKMLAVLRKDEHDFLVKIRKREDVFAADLDEYQT